MTATDAATIWAAVLGGAIGAAGVIGAAWLTVRQAKQAAASAVTPLPAPVTIIVVNNVNVLVVHAGHGVNLNSP